VVNTDILLAEEYSYILVDPRVFKGVEGYSYGRVLSLAMEEERSDVVPSRIVNGGQMSILSEEVYTYTLVDPGSSRV